MSVYMCIACVVWARFLLGLTWYYWPGRCTVDVLHKSMHLVHTAAEGCEKFCVIISSCIHTQQPLECGHPEVTVCFHTFNAAGTLCNEAVCSHLVQFLDRECHCSGTTGGLLLSPPTKLAFSWNINCFADRHISAPCPRTLNGSIFGHI